MMKTKKIGKKLSFVQVTLHALFSAMLVFNVLFAFSIGESRLKNCQDHGGQHGIILSECELGGELELQSNVQFEFHHPNLQGTHFVVRAKQIAALSIETAYTEHFRGVPLFISYEDLRI